MKMSIGRFLIVTLLSVHTFLDSKAQNSAILLDGTNDYVNINAPVASGASYTKEAWVFATSSSLAHNIISSASTPFWISGNKLRAGQAGNFDYVVDPADFPLNQWVHVGVTYNAASQTMKLYKNGKLVASQTGVPAYTSETTFIGCHQGSSSFFQGRIDEVRIWSLVRTDDEIKKGMYETVPSNSTGLTVYYNMNEGTGTTLTNSAPTSGLNGTLVNSPSWVSSPVESNRNALNFDGVNDQVAIPANAQFDFANGTIECWVKPENLVGEACFIGNRGAGGARWSFHLSVQNQQVGFWNNLAYQTIPYTITPGQWYHLAFVCNGTNVQLYVNGNYAGVFSQTFSSVSGQPLYIGVAKEFSTGNDMEPFDGAIDEVRIWNTLRTPTEIQTGKDVALTGAESGLVALYGFDQGISDGDNMGLTTAIDKTTNNLHGQLMNFSLSGSASNWSGHTELVTLPVRLTHFKVSKYNDDAYLQWQTANEQNSREFIIERSDDGAVFTVIGRVAAAGNASDARNYSFTDKQPKSGNNYYRLKEVDIDGTSRYSPSAKIAFAITQKLTWYNSGYRTVEVHLQSGGNEPWYLTDMQGRTIKKGHLSGGKVRLSSLPAGNYSILIETASGNVVSKIVAR